MAERKLQFSVGAKDEASQIFDRIASSAASAMAEVEASIDDSQSAGQRLASTLQGELDSVESSMRGTAEAAVALGTALGPELAGKIDLAEAATKFQQLGLSVDEIKADAEALSDVLRRSVDGLDAGPAVAELDKLQGASKEAKDDLEQLGKADVSPVADGTRRAREGVDELGKSADSSKSVLANMVGNTTQDLGDLGGIAGSAGVAIGQIGEYAADAIAGGEGLSSVLKNMGAVIGPVGALTLIAIGLQAIKGNMDAVAETQAFNEDRVRQFAEALSDASVSAQELAAALAVDSETGIFVRIENESVNVQQAIQNTLGTFDEFNSRVQQGKVGFDEYAASLVASAEAAGLNGLQMFNLRTALNDARDGTLDNSIAMGQLDTQWRDGIQTATALGAGISGIDTAQRGAATSAEFWGRAVAESGGDAQVAAQRTEDLRQKLNQFIAETERVPSSIVSEISANIDQGSLNRAEGQLQILTRNRTMNVSIVTSGGQGYTPRFSADGTAGRGAIGDTPSPGERTVVGEYGPEVVDWTFGRPKVTPRAASANILDRRSMPSIVINNNGRDLTDTDIARAIRMVQLAS